MKIYRASVRRLLPVGISATSAFLSLFFLFSITVLRAQTKPRISSDIDSTQIRIGEQLHFRIAVETDTTSWVTFPEGQTFFPLEMVEASATDTTVTNDKIQLIKTYALTQFDSGSYTLPRQQVLIDNRPYFTDSLTIDVRMVVVDTTQQNMYPIKPIVEVEKSYGDRMPYLIYGILALAILAGVMYWFVFREKPFSEAEKEALLPPYDRALLALRRLDKSRHLMQSEYKVYYSQLTDIVRSYLEEDAHIPALESTTNELITRMEMLKDSGNLTIDHAMIKSLRSVLQAADLVKFAKGQPETEVIQAHRAYVEDIVLNVKEALPEPTEEERLKDKEYLEEIRHKKRRRKIIGVSAVALALCIIASVGSLWYYGFGHVKDSIFGHPTKTLLEGEWITSAYGYPAVYLETPKVLKRVAIPMGEESSTIHANQTFAYGSPKGAFYIMLSATTYEQGEKIDVQKAIENTLDGMEANGAKNMIVKQEDFITPNGKEGIKVFGSVNIESTASKTPDKGKYMLLNFMQNGGLQQVLILYKDDDLYAPEIVNRIINSVAFNAGT